MQNPYTRKTSKDISETRWRSSSVQPLISLIGVRRATLTRCGSSRPARAVKHSAQTVLRICCIVARRGLWSRRRRSRHARRTTISTRRGTGATTYLRICHEGAQGTLEEHRCHWGCSQDQRGEDQAHASLLHCLA